MASCIVPIPATPQPIISGTKDAAQSVHDTRIESLEKAKTALTSLIGATSNSVPLEALKNAANSGVSMSAYVQAAGAKAETEAEFNSESEWISDVRIPTNKVYGPTSAEKIKPVQMIVMHYTASPDTPLYPKLRAWASNDTMSSTHIVIARNPKLEPTAQMAPLSSRTFHAGRSTWRGVGGVNNKSIGVDMDNVGYLTKEGDKFYNAYGGLYKGPAPFLDGNGTYWEPYTDEAVKELLRIVALLVNAFPILKSPQDRIVGHSDVKSTKVDPGSAFPWQSVRATAASGRAINISEV
jgi:N-acetylmuramoyl-L-alanine amidase